MKKTKKRYFLLAFALILSFSCLHASAASGSSKAAVQKSVNGFFAAAKKYNTKKMSKYFEKPEEIVSDTDAANDPALKSAEKLFKRTNKKLGYKISSIKVKGKKATVKVKCRYQDLSDVYRKTYVELALYIAAHPDATLEDALIYEFHTLPKIYKAELKKGNIGYTTKNITLKMRKSGNTWKIKKCTNDITDMLHGNILKTNEELFK